VRRCCAFCYLQHDNPLAPLLRLLNRRIYAHGERKHSVDPEPFRSPATTGLLRGPPLQTLPLFVDHILFPATVHNGGNYTRDDSYRPWQHGSIFLGLSSTSTARCADVSRKCLERPRLKCKSGLQMSCELQTKQQRRTRQASARLSVMRSTKCRHLDRRRTKQGQGTKWHHAVTPSLARTIGKQYYKTKKKARDMQG